MPLPPTNEEVFAYHRATGCPVSKAAELLAGMPPLLKERVLQAIQRKRALTLRDPIEDAPETAAFVAAARKEAEDIVRAQGPLRRGSSHAIWREQARILQEKHQLEWFSPQQMNPGVLYD